MSYSWHGYRTTASSDRAGSPAGWVPAKWLQGEAEAGRIPTPSPGPGDPGGLRDGRGRAPSTCPLQQHASGGARMRPTSTSTAPRKQRHPAESMTILRFCQRYGIGHDKVYGWIADGTLHAVNVATKTGGRPRWVIPPESLMEFEAQRAGQRGSGDDPGAAEGTQADRRCSVLLKGEVDDDHEPYDRSDHASAGLAGAKGRKIRQPDPKRGKWECQCPGHDDKRASLSRRVATTGGHSLIVTPAASLRRLSKPLGCGGRT